MLFKVKSHTSSSVRLNVLAIIEYSSDKVMENTPLSSVCKVMCKKNVNALYIECQIISVMFNTAALLWTVKSNMTDRTVCTNCQHC